MVGGSIAVFSVVLIVLITRSPVASTGPSDLPLAAPVEPETTTTIPPPRPIAPSDDWRLAVQTAGVLWQIDTRSGEMSRLIEPVDDSLPRGGAIVVLRTLVSGGSDAAFRISDGAMALIEPDGSEVVFQVDLPPLRSPTVAQTARFALTPRPVALVPVWTADGVLLRRAGLNGTQYEDIPLPGCGAAHPIAAFGTDRVFGVWCRDSDDLRLFYDGVELVEERIDEIRGDGLTPALIARGDKPLLVDPFGGVWGFSLFEQAFLDDDRPIAGQDGRIPIADDERILGIAASSANFEHIVVGVSSESDFDGTVTASRLAGYDPLGFTDGWSIAAPAPVVSLVGAPDGIVYGLGSDDDGGVLMAIEPATGVPKVMFRGLPVDEGRLMVLG